jgi:virginiamycin B lyase
VSPGTSKGITEYPIPTPNSVPRGITAGPDGALWFTEEDGSKIGRVDPASVSPGTSNGITEYPTPTPNGAPLGITAGPDGALWFADGGGNQIGRVDPASVSPGTSNGITEYPTPTPNGASRGITAGPDGALWFSFGNQIGRVDPASVSPGTSNGITEYPTPTPDSAPSGITAGTDGAQWFTEAGSAKIGRIPPALVTRWPAPLVGRVDWGWLIEVWIAVHGGDPGPFERAADLPEVQPRLQEALELMKQAVRLLEETTPPMDRQEQSTDG